ncbi:MAG: TauD/TfdA dioxygenase family protein [Myxococcota bacterium]
MQTSNLDIRPVGGALGAEIHGIDLRKLDDSLAKSLIAALDEHLVLFFPGQNLSPREHRDFSVHFGELEPGHNQLQSPDPAIPEVCALDSDRDPAADVFHTDVTFQESPPIASILNMVECAPKGGDTMWVNLQQVFDSLSGPMQAMLEGLTALHTQKGGPSAKPAEHPVVRVHPNSGRKSLYVNRIFTDRIVQLSSTESKAMLNYLFGFAEQPHFSCRYRWSAGDLGIWDNRATLHAAVSDYIGGHRVINRVTVLGDRPIAAAESDWPAHSVTGQRASDFFDVIN